MLDFLISVDTSLFFFLNSTVANPFFDAIMPVVTNINNWKIPIVIVWLFLIIKGGKRGKVVGVMLIPVLIFSDQISSFIVKPMVGRIRPCYSLEEVRLLVGCGGKYSFPSSHATNITGAAVLFTIFYRKWWPLFWFIAILIGFSRVYVGKHFPLDVIAGMLLGALIVAIVYSVYKWIAEKYPLFRAD